MKPWRNVLVHLDGKPSTTEALEKSVLVAEAFGGRVLAFDSVERAPFAPLFASTENERSLEIAAAIRAEQLREALAGCAERVPVEATSVAARRDERCSAAPRGCGLISSSRQPAPKKSVR